MNKKILAFALALIMLFSFSVTAAAAEEDVVFQLMVADVGEVLSDSEEEELLQKAWTLTQQYECAVYLITLPDLEGLEAWEYNEILLDEMEMGYGEEQSCVTLLLSVEERSYDILAHGYGNTAFTDYGKEVMAERFLPYFGDNDWYGGFTSYLDTCEEFLALAAEGTPYDVDSEGNSLGFSLILSIAIGCLVAFIVCSIFKSQMKTAKRQTMAQNYIVGPGLQMVRNTDIYTHTTRTERYIPPKDNSSSGGTTVNSGGSSHKSGSF